MSRQHLSCPACRIRVRANDPVIAHLEDRCPICGAALRQASSAAGVMGCRPFDIDELSEQASHDQSNPPGNPVDLVPVDLVSRREAASTQDDLDAHRWSDDGGNTTSEAMAQQPRTC